MGLVIAPEIGRTLHFHANGAQPYTSCAGASGPLAAKVVHVHGERMVNLVVWDANGGSFGVTSVELRQPDDATADSAGFYAEWMPWTVQQARKRHDFKAAQDALRAQFSGADAAQSATRLKANIELAEESPAEQRTGVTLADAAAKADMVSEGGRDEKTPWPIPVPLDGVTQEAKAVEGKPREMDFNGTLPGPGEDGPKGGGFSFLKK